MSTDLGSSDLTFWEEVAKTRWGSYLTREEARVLDRARELAGPPGTALEVGVEGGRWSAELQGAGWDMICTDIDAHTLALCAERLPGARCILTQADATSFPCEAGSVNFLLVYEVAPVTHSAWFPREAARVLTPDGVLVCSFDNPHSARAQVFKALCVLDSHRRAHRTRYYSGPSYASFRKTLTAAGFDVRHEVGIGWCPFPRQSNSVFIPPCVALERISGLRKLPRLSPQILLIARKTPDDGGQ
jgi:SAM-dependent methyltransferase